MGVLPVYHIPGPAKARGGHWIPGNWSYHGCELPGGCYELSQGPLQGQQMFSTTKPSFHQPGYQLCSNPGDSAPLQQDLSCELMKLKH